MRTKFNTFFPRKIFKFFFTPLTISNYSFSKRFRNSCTSYTTILFFLVSASFFLQYPAYAIETQDDPLAEFSEETISTYNDKVSSIIDDLGDLEDTTETNETDITSNETDIATINALIATTATANKVYQSGSDKYLPDDTVDGGSLISDVAIKGWVVFAGNGTIADDYNVDSVVNNSTGVYTITWGTNFANTNYCVVSGMNTSGGGNLSVETKAAGTLVVNTMDRNGTLNIPTQINIMAFGD